MAAVPFGDLIDSSPSDAGSVWSEHGGGGGGGGTGELPLPLDRSGVAIRSPASSSPASSPQQRGAAGGRIPNHVASQVNDLVPRRQRTRERLFPEADHEATRSVFGSSAALIADDEVSEFSSDDDHAVRFGGGDSGFRVVALRFSFVNVRSSVANYLRTFFFFFFLV